MLMFLFPIMVNLFMKAGVDFTGQENIVLTLELDLFPSLITWAKHGSPVLMIFKTGLTILFMQQLKLEKMLYVEDCLKRLLIMEMALIHINGHWDKPSQLTLASVAVGDYARWTDTYNGMNEDVPS